MFTREQINNWIELYQASDNRIDFEKNGDAAQAVHPFGKRDLLEAKVMVDRWDVVVSDWIFHYSKKDLIVSIFPPDNEDDKYENKRDSVNLKSALQTLMKYAAVLELNIDLKGRSIEELTQEELAQITTLKGERPLNIWGANVHFTDDISPNGAIGVSLDQDSKLMRNCSDNLNNSIVVFNVA